MSDHPDMPEHDEPSAAELERVRGLLAGLGEEPAPLAVVARLERVLESQLPAAGAAARRRPRRWVRRAVLGALPVAAIVAGALVLSQPGGNDRVDQQSAARSSEALSQEAVSSALAAPAVAPADAAADPAERSEPAPVTLQAPSATAAATPEELRQAALDAYRETRRVLLARRNP